MKITIQNVENGYVIEEIDSRTYTDKVLRRWIARREAELTDLVIDIFVPVIEENDNEEK